MLTAVIYYHAALLTGIEILLMPEHLKVKNVESIEDIVTSPEWLKFFDGLMNYPEKTEAYNQCKQICTFEGDIDIDPTAKRIKTKEQYK